MQTVCSSPAGTSSSTEQYGVRIGCCSRVDGGVEAGDLQANTGREREGSGRPTLFQDNRRRTTVSGRDEGRDDETERAIVFVLSPRAGEYSVCTQVEKDKAGKDAR